MSSFYNEIKQYLIKNATAQEKGKSAPSCGTLVGSFKPAPRQRGKSDLQAPKSFKRVEIQQVPLLIYCISFRFILTLGKCTNYTK